MTLCYLFLIGKHSRGMSPGDLGSLRSVGSSSSVLALRSRGGGIGFTFRYDFIERSWGLSWIGSSIFDFEKNIFFSKKLFSSFCSVLFESPDYFPKVFRTVVIVIDMIIERFWRNNWDLHFLGFFFWKKFAFSLTFCPPLTSPKLGLWNKKRIFELKITKNIFF